MKENLLETIVDLKKSGDPAALAVIVRTEGSTPRRAGTKMVVLKDGKTIGTMGGGDLKKSGTKEAMETIHQREPIENRNSRGREEV